VLQLVSWDHAVEKMRCTHENVQNVGATPQFGHETEHHHAGLIHPGFIHGKCASQRMGPVATGPVAHKQQRTLLRE